MSEEPTVAEPEAPAAPEAEGFVVSWTGPEGEEEHGPLQVLWQLIESYRIDIFDVSLNKITDDFLAYMAHGRDLRLEHASSFTVMAARLLFHKSRALLPDPGFDEPDEEPRLPPELIQQLLEYRKFQMAAEKIHDLDEVTSGVFTRRAGLVPREEADSEWLDVTLVDLIRAYADVLRRAGIEGEEPHRFEISLEEFSVEEKIQRIRDLLAEAISFAFSDLFVATETLNRHEVIAVFLALLELTKLGEIVLKQRHTFEEITVFRKAAIIR